MSAHTDTTLAFASIAVADLSRVSGGAGQTFQDFANSERDRIAPAYRNVVCTGASVKGGEQLAQGLWNDATDGEKIAAAGALRGLCMASPRLPSQAPAKPF
jgi:hypothetical protein